MKKTHKQLMAGRGQAADADPKRVAWWREARFGLFIHWGLYSAPAGYWKGERISGIGEWIMYNARIPVSEYEKLADTFNPVHFDAKQWVGLAKAAGMRYLVITAKHHDGFALFRSPSSPYNIVDATPFGRDPMAELAEACAEAGIKLGFYYSQDQDWHDPDGAWNDWDFDEEKKDFDAYFRRKVIPQVTELLTQYGPIGLIWFDTPYTIEERHSRELRELVHRLQPDCLVSGRVGNDLGDYGSLGDNQIPVGRITGDYETPATMNDTWGFRSDDENWKSVDTLLYLLIDLASKGINYLLNVGPTDKGEIPVPSQDRLKAIGGWLEVNGEAIYGTGPSPYPLEFSWGRITTKGNRLYLIYLEEGRDSQEIRGLKNRIVRAYSLSEPDRDLAVEQTTHEEVGYLSARITGSPGGGIYPVVVLELDGEPEIDESLIQQPDGTATLPAFMGTIHDAPKAGREIEITRSGFTDEWLSAEAWISWQVTLTTPGSFEVRVIAAAPKKAETRGHNLPTSSIVQKVTVELSGDDAKIEVCSGSLRQDTLADSPRSRHYPEALTAIGRVQIAAAGRYELALKADVIDPATGLQISGVELVSLDS